MPKKNASNLWVSRHGIYYVRVNVPEALRPFYNGKKEIRRSLATANQAEAIKRSRPVLVELEDEFARLASGQISTPASQTRGGPVKRIRLLSETVAEFLDDAAIRGLTAKTLAEYKACIAVAVDLIGDMPITELSRDHVRDLRKALRMMPSNASKKCQGMTARESIREAKRRNLPLLADSTINKILSRFSSFCKWAANEDIILKNPACGLKIKVNKRPDEEKRPYTRDELQRVFDGYIYKGKVPARSQPAPYQFWMPLLGIYTGARINELAQLYVRDIRREDGIWVFSILDDAEDKRVKSVNSRRIFPLHPMLERLGFIDYVRTMKKAGHVRIFPELPRSRDGYGQVPSKWFGRYTKRYGIEPNFHALRHTVATHLKRAGYQEKMVAEMLGHVRGETESFRRYGKAYGPAALLEMVSSIDFGLSLDHVDFDDFVARTRHRPSMAEAIIRMQRA